MLSQPSTAFEARASTCSIAILIFQHRADSFEQRLRVDRLRQVANRSEPHPPSAVRSIGEGGNQDDRDAMSCRYQMTLELKPTHLRHLHIHYQARRTAKPVRAEELVGGGKRLRSETECLHQPLCCFTGRLVVIND
jgi:hypothetical protein